MKNILKLTLIVFVLLGLSACVDKNFEIPEKEEENSVNNIVDEPNIEENEPQAEEIEESVAESVITPKLPKTFNLEVLFASQAPMGDWGLPYQEACEEASLIMVSKYKTNKALDNDIMDEEIKKLVIWQEEKFGYYTDTGLGLVQIMAKEYFDLQTEISEEVTIDNIKQHLGQGRLIVVPTFGKALDNSNFTGDGPTFHMLVIKGYDRNEFITNDPGTRNGSNFKYKYNNLLESVYDLPFNEKGDYINLYDSGLSDEEKDELMVTGSKRMLIVY